MRKLIYWLIPIALVAMSTNKEPSNQKANFMKLNAGIITPHLEETKKFYQDVFKFTTVFESDWFILLQIPGGSDQVAFLKPAHPSQQPLFQPAFGGKGVFFTIEVEDVDAEYKRLQKLNIPIAIDIRDEPWGDRHFAITDPNGVGVDVVRYKAPE